MGGLVLLTMAIVYLLPRLTKALPPALVAIVGVGLLSQVLHLPVRTLGDMAHIAGGLPQLALPGADDAGDAAHRAAVCALMAVVGLLETLLTFNLTDEITARAVCRPRNAWRWARPMWRPACSAAWAAAR
jgi:SulP family sulfate permease